MELNSSLSVPLWAILGLAFVGAVSWIIVKHGQEPFDPAHRPMDKLIKWAGAPYILLVFMLGFAALGMAFYSYLWDVLVSVRHMVRDLRILSAEGNATELGETLRNLAQGSALLLGAVVASATLIFTLIRTWINERTTRATEEGLITDRINKAVESLGAEKVVNVGKVIKQKWGGETTQIVEETRPNIEVRVGAILALERLARQNDSVHVQIMEILCSYLRANAPLREETRDMMAIFRENYKIYPWKQRPDLHVFQYNMPNHELPPDLTPPREDIQMALNVIGRRGDDKIAIEKNQQFRIDLRQRNFDRADLRGTKLEGANLRGAQLQGTDLIWAQLQGADLIQAKLQGADLTEAQLQGADLSGAQLHGAVLTGAQFDKSTNLTRTLLRLVRVRSVYLTDSTIDNAQLQSMFGDGSVVIEKDRRPKHWPTAELEWDDFYKEYENWAADPEAYVPPQDREE